MGTHPIFESDFDCLTDMVEVVALTAEVVVPIAIGVGSLVVASVGSWIVRSFRGGGSSRGSSGGSGEASGGQQNGGSSQQSQRESSRRSGSGSTAIAAGGDDPDRPWKNAKLTEASEESCERNLLEYCISLTNDFEKLVTEKFASRHTIPNEECRELDRILFRTK